ncbi:MAG: hypothetical protein HQL16_04690, partial [Candidatus Omnitrophica bacterium]|nr:hypothetical protein [Candidatus Omnitrophota bacterium]
LEQDYILKQFAATITSPETALGKDFWARVYAKVQEKFGVTDIPTDAFNKVWIMPDKAVVYEKGATAYIVENRLKVLTEQDYLALANNSATSSAAPEGDAKNVNSIYSQIVREVLIPEITREVNEGKNFANLRQIYHSLLLAAWYKVKVKNSILNSGFADKGKIAGSELADKTVKDQIYAQYVEAFKKGVYNYIKEDVDAATQETIPRKYFSGGAVADYSQAIAQNDSRIAFVSDEAMLPQNDQKLAVFSARMDRAADAAQGAANESPFLSNLVSQSNRHDAQWVPVASSARDVTTEFASQINSARQVEGVDGLVDRIKIMKVSGLEEGFVFDRKGRILYLSDDFKTTDPGTGSFDRVTGLLIFLAIAKIVPEYLYPNNRDAWEKADLLVKGKAAKAVFDWAKKTYQSQPLFVQKIEKIEQVVNNFKSVLWATGDTPIQSAVDGIFSNTPELRNMTVNEDGLKVAKAAQQEILNRVEVMMSLMAIQILFEGANRKQEFPAYENLGGATRTFNTYTSAGQLSSKFNPITIAHLAVTILTAYVESGVDTFYVNVSEFDPRKADIERTFAQRVGLANEVNKLFAGLVTILPAHKDIKVWNGEEVFGNIVWSRSQNRSPKGPRVKQAYTAGGDHFYVFAPDRIEGTLVGFTDVRNPKIRQYFQYYAAKSFQYYTGDDNAPPGEMTGRIRGWQAWQYLLKQQSLLTSMGARPFFTSPEHFESMLAGNSKFNKAQREKIAADIVYDQGRRVKVINDLLAAKTEEEFNQVLATAEILPNLDTFGKLYLIQKSYPKMDIVFAHTNRKEDMGRDILRDTLIRNKELSVVNVLGLDQPVSATLTRLGLISMAYSIMNGENKFPAGYLYGASGEQLSSLVKSPEIIETLLFQEGLDIPYVFNAMWHPQELQKAQDEVHKQFQKRYPEVLISEQVSGYNIVDRKKYETAANTVRVTSGGRIAEVTYYLRGRFNGAGYKEYRVIYKKSFGDDMLILRAQQYIKMLNTRLSVGIPVKDFSDPAQKEEVQQEDLASSDPLGGIDFNLDNVFFFLIWTLPCFKKAISAD